MRRAEMLGGLAIGALFLLPLLVWGPWDDEEAALGLFSSQVHYQALFHGQWLFWLNDLGFGTPLPIGQRLDFHPVFALGSLVSLRLALSGVWLVHVAVMVVYFLRLAAVTGIKPPMRMFLLACYVFSATTVGYFYQTDWLSVQIAWTLYPGLVFYLRQAVTGGGETSFWFTAILLAMLVGFVVLNSHPGYVAPLIIVLGVYVVAATPSARTWACLLVATALTAAVSAERIYFAVSEMRLFPGSLPRLTQSGYGLGSFVDAAVAPLRGVPYNLRLPFIGLALSACAVAAVFRVRGSRDAHTRACVVAFVAALALSVAPDSVLGAATVISGGWLFRDPMLLFGLMAGGLVLQRLYDSRTLRPVAWGLVVLQVAQQSVTIWPAALNWRDHDGRLQFYAHQGRRDGLAGLLVERAGRYGTRLYLAEDVRTLMRGSLSRHGIHVVTDLVFLGLNPVNAWFKGVSMDRLYPSWGLMHGQIAGQREVIENSAALDVLGVDLVLASKDGIRPAHELVATDQVHVTESNRLAAPHDLVLFANPDAWPTAVLMTAGTQHLQLPRQPQCRPAGAMCSDYSSFLSHRLPAPVSLDATNGFYAARFGAAEQERLLFVSAAYRPEWRASSPAGALPVEPVADAFLGVTVPAGVDRVELAFVPRLRIALTILSGCALAALMAAFAVVWWRRPGTA
jgi:hypothetical protein